MPQPTTCGHAQKQGKTMFICVCRSYSRPTRTMHRLLLALLRLFLLRLGGDLAGASSLCLLDTTEASSAASMVPAVEGKGASEIREAGVKVTQA